MRCPSTSNNEAGRLTALTEYGFSDEQPLPSLDPVVKIAAHMFDMPVAAINLIGDDHVFFAASHGMGETDMRRDVSFCAHTILRDDVMVVPDATLDIRFHDNPLVAAKQIRFYAGIPLRSTSGHALGALCVIDQKPHTTFSQQDCDRLRDLATIVSEKLELRRLEVARDQWPFRFEDVAVVTPGAFIGFDKNRNITFLNPSAVSTLGYQSVQVVGKPVTSLLPAFARENFLRILDELISTGVSPTPAIFPEVSAIRSNGSKFPVEISFFSWTQDGVRQYGTLLTDITERQEQKDQIFRLINFDSLTGLVNRSVLHRRVAQELASGSSAAIIAVDVDNFKDINDTLGHSIGDQALRVVSERILRSIRSADTLARIGGDEFAILIPDIGDQARCKSIAESVIAEIGRPIQIDDHRLRIFASCGIAISPNHGQTAEELLGNADLALYQAKIGGRGHLCIYVPSLRAEAVERRQYDTELHRAVENNEFELYYQPQICLQNGEVVGAEALIRWNHPQRGLLLPAIFLPVLQAGSLASTVGTWVLETACAQAAQWRRSGAPNLRIGVNLFAAQFLSDDLNQRVQEILSKYKLPPEALELEITENIILNRDELILSFLKRLRALGVCIAFDDFGTGYASLSMLRNYPLTRIKIDQTFIRGMCTSRQDEVTVSATVDLARNYHLEVIAEGVETEEQLAKLKTMRCDEAQGYLFGRPMSATQFSQTFNLQPETSFA